MSEHQLALLPRGQHGDGPVRGHVLRAVVFAISVGTVSSMFIIIMMLIISIISILAVFVLVLLIISAQPAQQSTRAISVCASFSYCHLEEQRTEIRVGQIKLKNA